LLNKVVQSNLGKVQLNYQLVILLLYNCDEVETEARYELG